MHAPSTIPAPGSPAASIDTPALVIDLDAMERNIARMAAFASAHGVAWRPHAKLHKCARLAQRLVAAGAVGCCVQKTGEAEALAAAGVCDIYLSNQVVSPAKLARLVALAGRLQAEGGRLALAADSAHGIEQLVAAIAALPPAQRPREPLPVFVEINIGQNRCGAAPGAEALALAQQIGRHRALGFAGLHAYHGGAQHIRARTERAQTMQAAYQQVVLTRTLLQAAGIAVPCITGAGTGTLASEAASGLYTELQPGSFLFMDADYARNEWPIGAPAFEHALFVHTQVISRHAEWAVCDAGHKSHAIDSGLPTVWNFGAPPVLAFGNGGDEHGILTLAAGASAHPGNGAALPALGETLWLVPGHCDPTVNLHDVMIGVRGGLREGVVEEVLRVDARGALG